MVLLQNPGKFAEAIKDPQVKHSDKILKVPLNLKEPYQIEKNFRRSIK